MSFGENLVYCDVMDDNDEDISKNKNVMLDLDEPAADDLEEKTNSWMMRI